MLTTRFFTAQKIMLAILLFTAGLFNWDGRLPGSGTAEAAVDQFEFNSRLSQGQKRRHDFRVKTTGTHNFKLTWNQSVNANVVLSRSNGDVLAMLNASKPGQRIEQGSKWLRSGDNLFATVYMGGGSNVGYTLDIDADANGSQPNPGNPSGAENFNGRISANQQAWHWHQIASTSRHTYTLSWTQAGANAELVISKLNGQVIARANSSGRTGKSEKMSLNLTKGQEYYAKVFVKSGSNVSYSLKIDGGPDTAPPPSPPQPSPPPPSPPPPPPPPGPTPGDHNAGYYYLDDANTKVKGGGFTQGMGYPRVMLTETQSSTGPYARYAAYQAVAMQASGLWAVENVQRLIPTHFQRMFTPSLTLEDRFDYRNKCTHGLGLPFEQSTATTGGCGVWAGHLVYSAGTQLAAPMARNANQIRVKNAQGFRPGTFLVIYNGGLKSFSQAEHVKIRSISGNTIYLAERVKSVSRARSTGAWVRQHEDGGRGPLTWVYNMSTQCPRDANGRTINEYMVQWLSSNNNLKRDVDGVIRNVNPTGFTFDVDTYVDVFTQNSDVNNDLVTDKGISPSGEHWWGKGVDQFYQLLRNRFPNFVMVGGVQLSGGFNSLNGVQIEGFPNGQLWKGQDDYSELNSMMSLYLYRMERSPYAPASVQNLMKWGTSLYPTHSRSRYGNAPMRLGLGLTAMDGGFFHHENTARYVDTWYDEYSVVSDKNADDFGRAVTKADIRKTRANTGWLGQPVGRFQRLYNTNAFKRENALHESSFETYMDGWSSNDRVTIRRTSDRKRDGSWSLAVSSPNRFDYFRSGAQVRGPSVNIQSGQDYTVVFSARAGVDRSINVKLGKHTEDFTMGPEWKRYVMAFRATESGSKQLRFDVGLFRSTLNLDSVMIFRGNANVFRRDFQRGSVIANGTASPVTVKLGAGYRRIKGTQDSVNNGANLPETVTIPAWDALFALKR